MKRYDYLILGGGIAALSAAEAIRASDGKGSVAMLSEESRPPYVRPMLTKLPLAHYRVENTLSRPAEWYRSENIDLFLNTRVTGLIPGEKRVCTEQGDFAYGKCIYALGAVNFIPPFRGKDLPGVCDLRSYEDLNRLRRCAVAAEDAVVIGGGVIGLEAAYVLAEHGLKVTVLETAPYLMPRLLDRTSAEVLRGRMTRFETVTDARVQAILGTERAEAVALEGREPIPAQVVLISCGVRANTALAQQAGLAVDRGVVVDERMRTSDEDIYSCGNCAVCGGFSTGLWAEAVQQGRVAGENAAGGRAVYTSSDSSLMLCCSEFALYSEGDLGMDKNKRYTTSERELRWEDGYRVNPAPCSLYERDYFVDHRLVGVFMLGDLRAMHLRRRALFGADR